ncbi:polysaccharide pyruvyl transferase family protein [Cellulomonas shaoxiangyii]|uniref:Polysaccharide pyruvyl transferase family protein n=1 Tax=Cellulomonas shaoxiangyii TaxID=2566013 RepID=A0A4P7SLW4_9CELL|nr:polysaccharide pyruvyl transferase family protein [Cellulomonas shaoxiangyii]QCB94537.1 polysaccharide pyruvyl transferase family protein [Cellulomonas shaoxiangyii]TGY82323.1 polysaccharide pyruvyl transferase family protein [Cellulomonas shaoxiangyii]
MRLGHYGTFDVLNYGDLLFPLLVRHRLSDLFDEIVHVSPVGGQPYLDVPASISTREATALSFDAVIVGGGNILHTRTTNLPTYRSVRSSAYADLWVGAARQAIRDKAPLVINAAGAPRAPIGLSRPAARAALRAADYVAVRDEKSAATLQLDSDLSLAVVPDTALELSDAAPDTRDGRGEWPDELRSAPAHGYVVAHLNGRYGHRDHQHAAAALDAVATATGRRICLIGIGECHGDDELARSVGAAMATAPIVFDRPRSARAVIEAIRNSAGYVGSSMHGYVTAASYGVPAALVVDSAAQHKFDGLLAHLGGTRVSWKSWDEAAGALTRGGLNALGRLDTTRARKAINAHWDEVRRVLTDRPARSGDVHVALRAGPYRASVHLPAEARQLIRDARHRSRRLLR